MRPRNQGPEPAEYLNLAILLLRTCLSILSGIFVQRSLFQMVRHLNHLNFCHNFCHNGRIALGAIKRIICGIGRGGRQVITSRLCDAPLCALNHRAVSFALSHSLTAKGYSIRVNSSFKGDFFCSWHALFNSIVFLIDSH